MGRAKDRCRYISAGCYLKSTEREGLAGYLDPVSFMDCMEEWLHRLEEMVAKSFAAALRQDWRGKC